MNSDDISNSLDDWKIFEVLREEHNVDNVHLSALGDSGRIGNLTGYDVSLLPLVWERSINNDSIEVILTLFSFLLDAIEVRVVVVIL